MPKNPDSPPWVNHREITTVNSQDIDYVQSKANGDYSELLLKLYSQGERTWTESLAKEEFPTESEVINKEVFLILVQDGKLNGPEGRLRIFTINDTWAAKKVQDRKELEEVKKAIEGEDEDDEEEEESTEESTEEGAKLKDRPEGQKKKKRALQDASNILSEIDAIDGSGASAFAKKNRRIDIGRIDPITNATDAVTASVLSDWQKKPADLIGILNNDKAETGLEEALIRDVTEQLTNTLQEDGILVSAVQSQCTESSISSEDFFKVLQWKHDHNHIFVDGDITDPNSTIYPV